MHIYKEIYVDQPEGFVRKEKEEYFNLLTRAQYRLRQASREWNKHVHNLLINFGSE